MTTFSDLGLRPEILKALDDIGFETPTEIQERAIPPLITEDRDLVALSQTGSGKTAAFGLPLLEKVDIENNSVQTLVLCPTRELCLQIAKDIANFSKHLKGFKSLAVYGGAGIQPQIKALDKGVHLVVATPGRCKDLIERRKLKLGNLSFAVLDEADEMLNMGFKEDLDQILSFAPENRQTLLFSATMSKEVSKIAKNYMNNPMEISVGSRNAGAKNIEHQCYLVNNSDRYEALKRIADSNPNIYAIVFCRTRRTTQDVASKLMQDGYNAEALHGDMSQAQRDDSMSRFRKRNLQMLVATDVAARGLDVDELTHVIHFQLPDEPEVYVHRSGRTGRAGNKGLSVSILSPSDRKRIPVLEKIVQKTFEYKKLPTGKEICSLRLYQLIEDIENTEVDEAQIAPFMDTVVKKLGRMTKEQLLKKLVHTEFNSFLEYYKNKGDINLDRDKKSKSKEGGGRRNEEGFVRYHINIGKKDKLNAGRLMGLLSEKLNNRDAKLGRLEILSNFSFFEVEESFSEKIEKEFKKGASFEGRNDVVIEQAKSTGKRKGRKPKNDFNRRGKSRGKKGGGGKRGRRR